MPGWYDDEWLDDGGYSLRPFYRIAYDPLTRTWSCDCPFYARKGRCAHIVFFRRTAEVPVLEKYL
jgi:hypothetical protein